MKSGKRSKMAKKSQEKLKTKPKLKTHTKTHSKLKTFGCVSLVPKVHAHLSGGRNMLKIQFVL
jgi:hypothetical protein